MEGTLSAKTNLGIVPLKPRIRTQDSPEPESSASHESKWDRQMGVLKNNFGPASILSIVSVIASVITMAFLIGSPIVSQAGKNESSVANFGALANNVADLKATAKENKEESAKALADGLAEIKALVKQSNDLGVANREEIRATRESTERQLIEVRQDTKGLWNWNAEIKGRVANIEAELKMLKKEK